MLLNAFDEIFLETRFLVHKLFQKIIKLLLKAKKIIKLLLNAFDEFFLETQFLVHKLFYTKNVKNFLRAAREKGYNKRFLSKKGYNEVKIFFALRAKKGYNKRVVSRKGYNEVKNFFALRAKRGTIIAF